MMKSKASPKGTPELGPSVPPGGDGAASDAPLLGGDTWSLADQSAAATSTGQGQGLGSGDFVYFDEDEASEKDPRFTTNLNEVGVAWCGVARGTPRGAWVQNSTPCAISVHPTSLTPVPASS